MTQPKTFVEQMCGLAMRAQSQRFSNDTFRLCHSERENRGKTLDELYNEFRIIFSVVETPHPRLFVSHGFLNKSNL